MTEIEKAITAFEAVQEDGDNPILRVGALKFFAVAEPACKEALAALRAQLAAQQNAPLTLEELRVMDGDKIHIHFIGTCKGFYNDETAPYYGQYEQYIQKYNGMLRACGLPLKYYGVMWLAYRRPPEQ